MSIAAQVLIALIALLHVYFVLLETVLFKTRGRRAFGLSAEKAELLAPAMSNQGATTASWWQRCWSGCCIPIAP